MHFFRSDRKTVFFLLLFSLLIIVPVFYSHGQDVLRELYFEADYDILYEAYSEALPKFLKILNSDPSNSNYNYKVGQCYLNIPGQKDKAIPYLEAAIVNTTSDYRDGVFKETRAPLDAYYALGDAYRINRQLGKAIETYLIFKEKMHQDYIDELVERQIKACKNVIELEKKPADFTIENLGQEINNKFSNCKPVISGDLSILAYTTIDKQGLKEMYICKNEANGTWGRPKNITEDIGSRGDCHVSGINSDGTFILIVKNDGFTADIYYSALLNRTWTKMKKMSSSINTKFMETHASFSPDDKTIYFTSNRKESMGELDIFTSELNEKGKWDKPVTIGEPVNTIYNEETPYLSSDNTLYFSSDRHTTMGGFDIFYSALKDDGTWEIPENIGYPINTTDDDMGFMPVEEGSFAYYSLATSDGYGALDIYKYEIFSEKHPHMVNVFGSVNLTLDELNLLNDYSITIYDNATNNAVTSVYPDAKGEFFHILPLGSYKIVFDVEGYEQKVEYLNLPQGYTAANYTVNVTLDEIQTVAELEPEQKQQEEQGVTLVTENTDHVDKKPNPAEDISEYEGKANFTIQVCATLGEPDMSCFTGLNSVKVMKGENGFHRCITGEYMDYKSANQMLMDIKRKGVEDAFINHIQRYYNLRIQSDTEGEGKYTIQIMALKKPVGVDFFRNLCDVKISTGEDGFSRYTVGSHSTIYEARKKLAEIQNKGYSDAYIRTISSISNY